MPTLREYKKRLKSAETIGQLSGAMRSASMAKYMKLSAANAAYAPYAAALESFERMTGEGPRTQPGDGCGRVFVLLSGNHGLCGGYHHELFTFFAKALGTMGPDDEIITCGQKANEYCKSKKLPVSRHFQIQDIPAFAEAKEISEYLRSLCEGGGKRVTVVCQRFHNMLKSAPEAEDFALDFPLEDTEPDGYEKTLFIPDRRTVEYELVPLSAASRMYSLLLSAAAGAQASTVIAMRSAYDNAVSSINELETRINRARQAAVTASVLETSAEMKE